MQLALVARRVLGLNEQSQYAFEVDINANKIQIASAIEKRFEVDVLSIRTIRYKGKRKTQFTRRGRFEGRRSNWKKAIVTLKEGQTIEILDV